jgi:hypothetical protein
MQFITSVTKSIVRNNVQRTYARSFTKTIFAREGVTGRLADDSEQATGLRKDELEEELKGNERFNRSMLWTDKIGTFDDPTRIPSALSSRIVGHNCTGWIRWCVVKAGDKPTVCPDCGHHFILDPNAAQQPL